MHESLPERNYQGEAICNPHQLDIMHVEIHNDTPQCNMCACNIIKCLRGMAVRMQDKEGRLVEKDVLAVDVMRCREALAAKVDEVLLVEQERAELQKTLEERRSEMVVGCQW